MIPTAVPAAALAMLLALPALAPRPATAPPEPGRPLVLVLPGRGLAAQDTAALRREWLDALNLGLTSAGAWPLLGARDLALVWYADALDPHASANCLAHERGGASGGGRAAPRPGSDFAATLSAALMIAAMVADWSEQLDGQPLRDVAGDLLYFGDDAKRCAAEERLSGALARAAAEGRPVVLVAHSFGALVAYGHLLTRPADAPPIERWITIGSLVGRPELRELMLGAEARALDVPAGVGGWVNVRDPGDALSAPLHGARPDDVAAGRVVDTVAAAAPVGDPHDAARYLSDPVTAAAALAGWCSGLGERAHAERACRPR